jgi:hypothetical protein
MTRTVFGLATAALISACADSGAPVAPTELRPSTSTAAITTKTEIDEVVLQFVPCANEVLRFRIRQQLVEHTTIDPNGTLHEHFVINDKGTKAEGTVTGRVWNQTGATTNHLNVSPSVTGNRTFVNSLNLIGRGSAPDLRVQEVFHITVNRRGVVTVDFGKVRSLCRP